MEFAVNKQEETMEKGWKENKDRGVEMINESRIWKTESVFALMSTWVVVSNESIYINTILYKLFFLLFCNCCDLFSGSLHLALFKFHYFTKIMEMGDCLLK